MHTSTREKLWVLRAQCRDRDALEALLRSVQPSLRRYLSGLVGTTDADDLLQDVLVIIVRKIQDLEDPAVFRPWTFRIASRQAFRHLKKRRVWQQRHEDDAGLDAMAWPELPIEHESVRQLVTHGSVSPASRAVLLLHFELELSLPEVAAILEIPVGTAKSRLAYGLRSIRQYLRQSGGSHGREQ